MDKKNRDRVKRVIWGAFAVVLVALLGWAFRPRPLPVETALVDHGPMQVTVDGDGKTRVKERYTVPAPASGRMARITLRPGDRVEEGGAITVIDAIAPPLLDVRTRTEGESRVRLAAASLERSMASLEVAREQADHARTELDRQALLMSRGAAPRAQYDEAKAADRTRERELDAARFAVEADRQQLAVSRAALISGAGPRGGARVTVTSPIAGTVLRVLREDAGPVTLGASLAEVGDLSRLELVVDLISTAAVEVEPGFPVRIEHWGGGAPLSGRVQRVEPAGFTKVSALGVEEQRVNVIVDLAAQERAGAGALGDGYHAEARIVVWSRPEVVRVPLSALFREGDAWAVFVVAGGKAQRRLLRLGHRDDAAAEVLGGVEAGQRVIIHPGDKIKDGVKVEA